MPNDPIRPIEPNPATHDLARWFMRSHSALTAYAYRYTHNRTDTEDLLQEALVRALSQPERIPESGTRNAWFRVIIRRLYIDAWRRRTRSAEPRTDAQEVDRAETQAPRDHPEQAFEHAHFSGPMERALASLPEGQRVPLVLADVWGWSHSELAAKLGCPQGTVMSRAARGRAHLRRRLEPLRAELLGERSGTHRG